MLFGKFCIDYSSGQFDILKHCTEPENTKTIAGSYYIPNYWFWSFVFVFSNKQQFVFLRRWTVFCLPPFLIAGDKSVSLRAEGVQAFVRPLLLYLERNDKE